MLSRGVESETPEKHRGEAKKHPENSSIFLMKKERNSSSTQNAESNFNFLIYFLGG